jgi:hypothetical protein
LCDSVWASTVEAHKTPSKIDPSKNADRFINAPLYVARLTFFDSANCGEHTSD